MKLKPDIVRDILLTVEDECDFDNRFVYDVEKEIPDRLKPYSVNEIAYHVRQCELAELILGVEILEGGEDIIIADLSPEGHEFLANIRKDKIWKNTKAVAKETGCRSLTALTQISANIVTALIKSHFKLT